MCKSSLNSRTDTDVLSIYARNNATLSNLRLFNQVREDQNMRFEIMLTVNCRSDQCRVYVLYQAAV